jgi:hypothetical protein
MSLLLRGLPSSTAETAKLLVWCFIVGFSERLIPDYLTQLSASVKTT